MEPTFGRLHADELVKDGRLRSQAFSVDVGPVDPDRPLVPLDRVHVARLHGELIGTATVFPFGQWFGGRSVPMGGLAGVAVAPQARGLGVARQLVGDAIAAMRDRGEVLSSLYPTAPPLYRSMGYEFAGRYERTTVDLHTVAAAAKRHADDPSFEIQQVGGVELERLRPLYDRLAAESPGWLDRSDLFWERLCHEIKPDRHNRFCYLLTDSEGTIRAGLTVSHRAGTEPLKFGLDIGGPFADSPAAMRAALLLVATMGATADRATFSLPVEQLGLAVPAPYLDHADSWLWMTRIVDLAGAITARGYNPHVTADVVLAVSDPVAPWNDGRWALSVANGEAMVERIEDDGQQRTDAIELDIQTLSALFTGFLDPDSLARAGKLPGTSRVALDAVAGIFAGPAPRLADFF